MSISDYAMQPGIDVIASGPQWSIWHEPATDRWRFDVWPAGDVCAGKCAPMSGAMTKRRVTAAAIKLWMDAHSEPTLLEGVIGLRNYVENQSWVQE